MGDPAETYVKKISPSALFEGEGEGSADHSLRKATFLNYLNQKIITALFQGRGSLTRKNPSMCDITFNAKIFTSIFQSPLNPAAFVSEHNYLHAVWIQVFSHLQENSVVS